MKFSEKKQTSDLDCETKRVRAYMYFAIIRTNEREKKRVLTYILVALMSRCYGKLL